MPTHTPHPDIPDICASCYHHDQHQYLLWALWSALPDTQDEYCTCHCHYPARAWRLGCVPVEEAPLAEAASIPLLPCPGCGGSPLVLSSRRVQCSDVSCGWAVEGDMMSDAALEAQWNRRTLSPASQRLQAAAEAVHDVYVINSIIKNLGVEITATLDESMLMLRQALAAVLQEEKDAMPATPESP